MLKLLVSLAILGGVCGGAVALNEPAHKPSFPLLTHRELWQREAANTTPSLNPIRLPNRIGYNR